MDTRTIALVGQVLFGLYFLYNGLKHWIFLNNYAQYAASRKVPAPKLGVAFTGLLLVLGGLSIITGMYLVYGLTCLVIFLVVVTLVMHSFWMDSDPMARMGNSVNFFKNIALLGAVLFMYGFMDLWPWVLRY